MRNMVEEQGRLIRNAVPHPHPDRGSRRDTGAIGSDRLFLPKGLHFNLVGGLAFSLEVTIFGL